MRLTHLFIIIQILTSLSLSQKKTNDMHFKKISIPLSHPPPAHSSQILWRGRCGGRKRQVIRWNCSKYRTDKRRRGKNHLSASDWPSHGVGSLGIKWGVRTPVRVGWPCREESCVEDEGRTVVYLILEKLPLQS